MTAVVAPRTRTPKAKAPALIGSPTPRLAPPVPVRSDVPALVASAEAMGIRLMPWQETAARYLTATSKDGTRLYREVCIVVARQNGKTTLLKPYIVQGLRSGLRFLHIAQTRELPREMFGLIADALSEDEDLFPKRRGKTIWPRYGSGQEEIVLVNGGSYRIAASNRGGARGRSVDRVIIDETRELVDWDTISAAEPTLTMSPDPQTIYLSNAGTDESVVLNALRERGLSGMDPSLAYLEWSAAPEREPDDRDGWAEANPALGHFPQVYRELERSYTARKAENQMGIFETERLCRWVKTLRAPFVTLKAWAEAEDAAIGDPVRPYIAVSMDPEGKRASVAAAWRREDGTIALRMLFDVPGDPIDTDRLGKDIRDRAAAIGAQGVAFDPMTDAALSRWLRRPVPVNGAKYANASARFVAAVEAGTLRWTDCAGLTEDLSWTTRKDLDDRGSFEAVRGSDSRPITASLAAIRAVWLASDPPPRSRVPGGF